MNNNDKHYNMTYKDGENTDILDFNPSSKCASGGLYFTDLYNFDKWNSWNKNGQYLRIVSFKDDEKIYVENTKFKCHSFHLSEKILINKFIKNLDEKYQKIIIKQHNKYLKLLDESFLSTNEEDCLKYIKLSGCNLRNIVNKTDNICLEAVKKSGLALKYVDNQTPLICEVAVSKCKYAINFVKDKQLRKQLKNKYIK